MFLKITAYDKDGELLEVGKTADELSDKLKNGYFCVLAKDPKCNEHGYIVRFSANRVTLGNGVLYDIDLGHECKPDHVTVTEVKVSNKTLSMAVGETATLSATVLPENATDKSVQWSSDKVGIVSVSKSGKLTAKAEGVAKITVTTTDAGLTDVSTVTVIVHQIILDEPDVVLDLGTEQEISYTTSPESYNPTTLKVISSDPTIVEIKDEYTLHGIKKGEVTVTVSDPDNKSVTTSCSVKVTQLVKSLKINKERLDLEVGKTEQLSVTILPTDADNKELTWVANGGHISVSETGLVTALSAGTSNVFVSTKDGSELIEQCVVEVIEPVIENTVTFKEKTINLNVGDSKELEYTVTPPDHVTEYTITSNNKSSIVVNGTTATAVGAGTAVLTIVDKNNSKATDTCTINVTQLADSVTITPNTSNIEVDGTQQLTATVLPNDTKDKTVTWKSSSDAIASVSSTGLVTGKTAGDVTITSTTKNGKTATATVTVADKTE